MAQLIEQARPHIHEADVTEFKSLIESTDHVLIDIREPAEFATGSIKNAINIPRGILEGKLSELACVKGSSTPLEDLNKKHLLLFCRSGARSVLAAESLQKMGFTQVTHLIGGILAWNKSQQ